MAWQVDEVLYFEFSKSQIISFFEVIDYLSVKDVDVLLAPLNLYDSYLQWYYEGSLPSSNRV